MSVQTLWPQAIDFFDSLPIFWQTSTGQLSQDGGLLLFRQLDERLGFTRDFASARHDPRDPGVNIRSSGFADVHFGCSLLRCRHVSRWLCNCFLFHSCTRSTR